VNKQRRSSPPDVSLHGSIMQVAVSLVADSYDAAPSKLQSRIHPD
jgi:hypothetical protein